VDASKFESLVVPSGNNMAPIHRWFHVKEAYSRHLLPVLLDELKLMQQDELAIGDPFLGSGTTLLSAVDHSSASSGTKIRGIGYEVNPALHLISEAKLLAATRPPRGLAETLSKIHDAVSQVKVTPHDVPALSTFHNVEYFPEEHVWELTRIRKAIEQVVDDTGSELLAYLCLVMSVGPAGRLRRDGRALRREAREPQRPLFAFEAASKRVLHDISTYARRPPAPVRLETRNESSLESEWTDGPAQELDLILFSPPYPNNIDYTEVYKTELWALGKISTPEAFRAQRLRTVRSHPSVKFDRSLLYLDDPAKGEVQSLIDPILNAIPPKSRYRAQMERTVGGYADDMYSCLKACQRQLKSGGFCVYVVGNSVHGTPKEPVLIAGDILMASLAELAGLEVVSIRIARTLPRRKVVSELVRESVVVLRKS
jgi:DNA modification methylase